MDHDLDLAASLNALDGELSNGLLGLPDNLADLLFLFFLRIEVRVILILGGLVLLSLGLGLGDLDIAGTLAHADQDIATLLRSEVLCDAAGGKGGLGTEEGLEGRVGLGSELNANSFRQVGGDGDHRVNGLLDVLVLELLDQGSLEGGTSGRQFGGVNGSDRGGRSQDFGLLGEDVAGQGSELGGVGNTTGEDDLINIKDIELSLLNNLLDQSSELAEDLAGEKLETGAVNGGTVVDTIDQGLNAQLSVAAQAEGLAGGFTLELQLGQTTSVLAGVGLVLLHELLGEVVNDDLIQGGTAKLVVVGSGQDSVHATAAGNNGNIGAGATEVSNNNQLVGNSRLGAGIVSHNSSNGLMDQLEDVDASSLGRGNKGLTLGIGEIGGDGDNGGVDILTKVVRGGASQALEVTGGDLRNSDCVGGLALSVADGESDGGVLLLGVGRLVTGSRIDRLEFLADEIAEVCDSVSRVTNKLGLGLGAVVLLALDVRKDGRNLTI